MTTILMVVAHSSRDRYSWHISQVSSEIFCRKKSFHHHLTNLDQTLKRFHKICWKMRRILRSLWHILMLSPVFFKIFNVFEKFNIFDMFRKYYSALIPTNLNIIVCIVPHLHFFELLTSYKSPFYSNKFNSKSNV